MPWVDPTTPKVRLPRGLTVQPNGLLSKPLIFGKLEMWVTPWQWEACFAPELDCILKGSVRAGKSWGAYARDLRFTLWIPDNLGIIGRRYKSDLEETAQRDFNELAEQTGLVKSMTATKTVMYCVNPATNEPDPNGRTSEVQFVHLDNPNHIKGRGIGWYHIEELSEVEPAAKYRLADRLSHRAGEPFGIPPCGWSTTNPEGRNWIWKAYFSKEDVESLPVESRRARRGILFFTRDNPHLPKGYIQNLINTAPAEWVRRYIDGEDDVFEGQIHKEYSPEIHEVHSRDIPDFPHGEPPMEWDRYIGIDVGGSNPWAFEFCAVDPWGNLVFYDEIWGPEVYVGNFKEPLAQRTGTERTFKKIVIDWENKQAKEELRRLGLNVTNAAKRGKIESVNKLARYLHPNPERRFPPWHPKKGQTGAPAFFAMEKCKHLREEIPLQRWADQNSAEGSGMPDKNVVKDAWDGCRYIIIERPEPIELESPPSVAMADGIDLNSRRIWLLRADQENRRQRVVGGRYRIPLPPRMRRIEP